MLLVGIHAGVSSLVESKRKDEERLIPLGENDAKNLSQAIVNVARHYPQLEQSQKAWDHVQLVIVAGSIYGPLAVALAMRAAQEKRDRQERRNIVALHAGQEHVHYAAE